MLYIDYRDQAASGAGVQVSDCKFNSMWIRSLLKKMKYLLKFVLSFIRSGVEANRGIAFHHSTCNAYEIRWKVGNEVS